MSRASSIKVRSTTSTATGPSLTMCCAASMALRKEAKWQMPSALFTGSGASFSSMRRDTASVPSEPHSRVARFTGPAPGTSASIRVSAHPPAHLGKRVRDVLRLPPAEAKQVAEQRYGWFTLPLAPPGSPLPACGESS